VSIVLFLPIVGNDDDNVVFTTAVDAAGGADDETIDCVAVLELTPGSTATAVWA